MRWNQMAGALVFIAIFALVMKAVEAVEEPAELKNETVKIQDIINNETAFDGQYVVIEGKITSECGSGCWFIVDDGTGLLYVDIKPNNLFIPQKTGSDVKIYGKITTVDNDPLMIGKVMEIGGEIIR